MDNRKDGNPTIIKEKCKIRYSAYREIRKSIRIRYFSSRGWSGGAMVLSKLPVPGRPTNFD